MRAARSTDAAAICRVYNHYVTATVVTLEEEPVKAAEMAERIREEGASRLPWLVAARGDEVCGFAHASRWKGRCAYRYAVETSVYVAPEHAGRGLGTRLYRTLLEQLADLGMHAAVAGIALPNEASVALHEKLGFKKVAHFREVGYKLERWIDVGYWELLLEGGI